MVTDASKVVRYVVSGTWDNKIDCAKVVYHKTSGGKGAVPPSSQKGQPQTLPPSTIWTRVLPP